MSETITWDLQFTSDTRVDWLEEDLRNSITRWINDRDNYPKNYGHFEQIITNSKLIVGCNVLFDNTNTRRNLKSISGYGNTYGAVKLPEGVLEYEGGVNNISGTKIDNFGLQLNPNWDCPYVGDGHDGELVVDSSMYISGEDGYRPNYSAALYGSLTSAIGTYPVGTYSVMTNLGGEIFSDGLYSIDHFNIGDEVMILQTQDYSKGKHAGVFEFKTIESIESSSYGNNSTRIITFTEPTENYYVVGNGNCDWAITSQIIRIPNYTDVTIPEDTNIIAKAWSGYHGGVICFRCSGLLTINGDICATGCGFRGGQGGYSYKYGLNYTNIETDIPTSGESPAGFGNMPSTDQYGRVGKWGSGGAGSNAGMCSEGYDCGGNGAGAGYVVQAGDGGTATYAIHGHGGYMWETVEGGKASEITVESDWEIDRILLGPGGGGAGGCETTANCYDGDGICSGPNGGNGGGAIKIFASKIILSGGGKIISNGLRPKSRARARGGCTGNGGAGAGGFIWVSCLYLKNDNNYDTDSITCRGTLGGDAAKCYWVDENLGFDYWRYVKAGGYSTGGLIRMDVAQYFGSWPTKAHYVSGLSANFNLWELMDYTDDDRNFMGHASYPVNRYYYAMTTNINHIPISNVQRLDSIAIDNLISYQDDSVLFYKVCLSFDNRNTWKIWDGGNWVVVNVDSPQTWMDVDDLNDLTGYEFDDVEALTSETKYLDVAISIKTTNASKTPFITNFRVVGCKRNFAIWDVSRPRSFAGIKNKDINSIC